jgi:molybdate transport repressor ModE-like protein
MDITLKQMQIFRAVVIAGSITKASRRVGLSQPSISQQLAKLEERLGTQLINRNRTGTVS